jgi:subtilisin family serine protease
MSRLRPLSALLIFAVVVTGAGIATGAVAPGLTGSDVRAHSSLPDGFQPAVLSARSGLDRYIVRMDSPAIAGAERAAGGKLSAGEQERAAAAARASQSAAIAQARSLCVDVVYRYDTLVNGFSVAIDAAGADALAARGDVRSVEPVSIVTRENETSVPFIGATDVWDISGMNHTRGQGVTVAVVDTGVDYTHANFGGPGTVQAYEDNDPTVIEPGSFPTAKVVGGYDLVGENYDVLDADPANDVTRSTTGSSGITGRTRRAPAAASAFPARSAPAWRRSPTSWRSRSGTRATPPTTCWSPAMSAPWTRTTTATPPTAPT